MPDWAVVIATLFLLTANRKPLGNIQQQISQIILSLKCSVTFFE